LGFFLGEGDVLEKNRAGS